jgi:transposase InsO family protein
MTFLREAFTEYRELDAPIEVNTASGARILAIAEGTVRLTVALGDSVRTVTLTEVLHVPKLTGSLISVLQLQDKGITVRTTVGPRGNKLLIELQGTLVGVASRLGRAYTLDSTPQGTELAHNSLKTTVGDATSGQLWHQRFGHLSPASLRKVHAVTSGLKGPIAVPQEPCEACIKAKTVRVVSRKAPERAKTPLERVHSDFWGPYSVPTVQGSTYMLTFTDDYTRKSWVYLTKARSQLRTIFLQYKALVELESGHKIKAVRCDNASEYKALGASLLSDYGIQFEYTTAYSPEQNGVSERLNRSLISVARAMLIGAELPIRLWGEAVLTASYLRNRTPIGPEGKTPEEAYSGRKPDIGHLRAYGCVAYTHIPREKRLKLDDTAIKTCLIGYMPTSRQYRLYEPKSGEIIVSTAPVFTENQRLQWNWGEALAGEEVAPFNPMEADEPEGSGTPELVGEPGSEPVGEPASMPRTPTSAEEHQSSDEEGSVGDTIVVDTGALQGSESDEEPEAPIPTGRPRRGQLYANAAIEAPPIPRTYDEAMSNPLYKAHWEQAISEELTKLQALDTWKIVTLPPGKKAVGCKWVFTVKYTPTGLIDRYKARLVAQGFSQVPGDDFLETFSPTIRAESLRILLALGTYEDLEIRQIDVVSAYPRSKLHATVYMKPPKALKCPKDAVLLLNRALYGLKQSGREWYIEACRGLKSLGFSPCFSEPSVFITTDRSVIIGLYVDDMVVLGDNLRAVQKAIQGIASLWEIKDLGDVSLILGLRIRRNRQERTLCIDQSEYIQGLIERFRLGDAKPLNLPINDRTALTIGQPGEQQADQGIYQEAIGCMTWVSRGSRPDITYVIGQLSQYCNEPTVRHWNAVVRVLRYLKGTINYSISYGKGKDEGPKLQGYSDADYAGNIVDRRSVTGHLYLLNSGPVTWTSTKQRCVATSTTESEYIGLSEASKQGQWIRALLRELQRTQYLSSTLSVPIFSDNQGCIALARDPVAHNRTKHIDVRYHYIRELIAFQKATVEYIPTEDMKADILTKPLPVIAFRRCIEGLCML